MCSPFSKLLPLCQVSLECCTLPGTHPARPHGHLCHARARLSLLEDLWEDVEMRAKAGLLLWAAFGSADGCGGVSWAVPHHQPHSLLCPLEANFREQETPPQAGGNSRDFPRVEELRKVWSPSAPRLWSSCQCMCQGMRLLSSLLSWGGSSAQ